jgi:hypothetical protein
VIGRTLAELFAGGDVRRDEVVLCSKGGYLPFDGRYPADPRAVFYETYVKPGLLAPADIVAGGHSLAPAISAISSREPRNLRVDDDRPLLSAQSRESARRRSARRGDGRIGAPSACSRRPSTRARSARTASRRGTVFRVAPNAREYLALADLVALAEREIGPAITSARCSCRATSR